MKQYALVAVSGYTESTVAVCHNRTILSSRTILNQQLSGTVLIAIDTVMKEAGLTFDRLSHISVAQGPSPYTSLRVILTTINGIATSANLPIIGVDSLEGIMLDWYQPNHFGTAVILNAFGKHVYYIAEYHDKERPVQKGWHYPEYLFSLMQGRSPENPIALVGNGIDKLCTVYPPEESPSILIIDKTVDQPSISAIAELAIRKMHKGIQGTNYILPNYVKPPVDFRDKSAPEQRMQK